MQNIFADKPDDVETWDSPVQSPLENRQSIPVRSEPVMRPQAYSAGSLPLRYARSFAPPMQPRHFRKKLSET